MASIKIKKESSVSKVKENTKVKEITAKKSAKTVKIVKSKTEEPLKKTLNSEMSVDVFNIEGKKIDTIELPEELFGVKINKSLVAQAVRVYLVNNRQGTVSTKTRGEVAYSTRKIYQQKGTGRARHGGRGAPIFVKGGTAHGPKPKEYDLTLPKAMRKSAFKSALSSQKKDNAIFVVSNIEDIEPKTKSALKMFNGMGVSSLKRNLLFVLPKDLSSANKAIRNLEGVKITTAQRINTYDVISHKNIVIAKEAIEALVKRIS